MKKLESNLGLIKRLIPYYKQNLGIFILDLVFAITTSILDLAFPIMVKVFVHLIEKPKPDLILSLIKLGFLYILVLALEHIGTFYVNYVGHSMGTKIETSMRNDLFAHCQKISVSYHDNNKIGQIISRLTNDLSEIGEFAHHAPEDILIALTKSVVPFIVLFNFNCWITLTIYGLLIPTFLVIGLCFKRMKAANQEVRVQFGELSAKIEDGLLGLKLTKSFSNEAFEQEKFAIQNEKTLKTKIKFYKYFGFLKTFVRFAYCMEVLIFVLCGGLLLSKKLTDGATLFIYAAYLDKIMAAISKFLGFSDMYQRGLTGINRFCEIVDLPVKKKTNSIELNPATFNGKIEFKNVTFAYDSNSKPVLKNFNLKVNSNEKIAIIGASGTGKTTICNLLENFYSVQKGEVLIDNLNVEEIDSNSLHKTIGLIQQNVYLITGTILDNIKLGKLNATFEEVVEAAKKAKIFNFINSLENKFETYIGENGTKLSGGQKQQISIARIFLKNPKILILDEATSSLDSENEKIILQALKELSKNKTTITIAHKLHTVKNSDMIYLLKDGAIVESGTHSELMKKENSIYKNYYKNLTD